jgi:hypothetical protein
VAWPARAGGQTWHHLGDAGFVGMTTERVMGVLEASAQISKEILGSRQCVTGSESLKAATEKPLCEAARVKL